MTRSENCRKLSECEWRGCRITPNYSIYEGQWFEHLRTLQEGKEGSWQLNCVQEGGYLHLVYVSIDWDFRMGWGQVKARFDLSLLFLEVEVAQSEAIYYYEASRFEQSNQLQSLQNYCMRKSFVLESLASCREISGSPLNRSSAKHLWSFSKEQRFPRFTVSCQRIYDTPSLFDKTKGAALGYGEKHDFTQVKVCSPGAKYHLKSTFEKDAQLKRGYSMNLAKEKMPRESYIELEPLRTPGATRYNNSRLEKGLSYSMRLKTKPMDRNMSIEPKEITPGPGKYGNPEEFSPKGRYATSKFRGTGATKFNPRSSKRFLPIGTEAPGPGTYKEVNNISTNGFYPLSSTRGDGKRTIDKERRVIQFQAKARQNDNPGPGSYRSPSQFGLYDGAVYTRMSQREMGYSRVTPHQSKF